MNMAILSKQYKHEIIAFFFVLLMLLPVHIQVARPMLLLERFLPGWGWIEIIVLAVYAAFIVHKMIDSAQTAKWRLRIWLFFSFVFFSQLILGLFGFEKFLMTGELHFPIPAMIIAGPVYRFQVGFMPILFLSTIILSGPAWCSQLCYFGALDGWFSGRGRPQRIKNKKLIRHSIFFGVILFALLLRLLQLDMIWGIVMISTFGIMGLGVILVFSFRKKVMVHCTTWCPVGVAVSYLKFINPFRIVLGNDCTLCGKCTRVCRYDALNKEDLKAGKPGLSCTWCGDCLTSCSTQQIYYRFFNLTPELSRVSWIILTVVIHTVFLGLARI
jgi:ferredoxin